MARLAEIWAENLEKRIISAGTKEEKFKLLTDAFKLTNFDDDDKIGVSVVIADNSVGRTAGTDIIQLRERVLKTRATVIVDLAIKYGLRAEMIKFSNSVDGLTQKNCGSSPEQKPLEYLYCANANVYTRTFCLNRGSLRCTGCFLVAYCSRLCQTEHWQMHKEVCNSKLASPDWKPAWMLQQRLPNFLSDVCERENVFNGLIWGNTPAFDLMRWQFNETKNLRDADVFDKSISMAFIDSGDFRNVIETLASVPENVTSPLHVVINDSNPVVVARNFLKLWALYDRGVDAVDAVLQVWYSSMLPKAQYGLLFNLIKASYCEDVSVFSDRAMVFRKKDGNTFSLSLYQGDVVLKTLCGMSVKNSFEIQAITDERMKVLCHPRHKDQLEAYIFQLKPQHRVSWDCFRKFGEFMPFNAYSCHFNMANKFIMNPHSSAWPMTERADPMNGWDMRNVEKFAKINKLPKNDVIGCLYFYVRDRLLKALATLERLPVQIDFYCKDPKELSKTFSRFGLKFDRIETGNLADENCVGLSKLLLDWAPLLNKKNENSVLITLFTNWFGKNTADLSENELLELLKNVGPEKIRQSLEECANGNRCALRALQDESKEFEEFLKKKVQNLKKLKVAPRMQHRVVPHRLFAPIDATENFTFRDVSDEENYFVSRIVRACSLRERYIEWILK